MSDAYLLQNYPGMDYTFTNASISGHNIWSNLVRLSRDVLAYNPSVVILDTANSSGVGFQAASLEAYCRRIWAANPNTRILMWDFPTVASTAVDTNINTPTNQDDIDTGIAICNAYGVVRLQYWEALIALIGAGNHLTDYFADTVHPNSGGHAVAYSLVQPYLVSGGGSQPAPLPARLYDNGDYENESTIKLGTDYDSRSGTWADNGTEVSSSTVGSIITYSATCQSFGAYRTDGGTNDVQVSIDGGAYADSAFYQNGTAISGGRAAHTIAVKVKSGTVKITEFWAI